MKGYKVVAITAPVKSFVDNIIIPFISALVPSGDGIATLALGPVNLEINQFLA